LNPLKLFAPCAKNMWASSIGILFPVFFVLAFGDGIPAEFHETSRGAYIPRHYGAIYLEDANLPNSTLQVAHDIPDRFDAHEQWPHCASVIGRIRDQSDCGACWAFGTTTAFNDRLCIATGNSNIILSPWDTLTNAEGMGCGGGNPDQTWQWLSSTGVVTGGDFSDVKKGTTCQPYEFGFCDHHEANKDYTMCPPPNCPGGCKLPGGTLKCTEASYKTSYGADKHVAASAYSIHGEEQMQTEIMTYGPITVGFDVYQNWEFYRSGVYVSTDATAFMGGHAVKIIGWGVCTNCKAQYICHSINPSVPDSWCLTNCLLAHPYNCPADTCACDKPYPPTTAIADATPVPYWLVANSWNPTWGEKGFFRILRGSNLCGFEGAHVSAGHAKTSQVFV